jgi:ubiquinone/menaquinone biosynthesis C-methylase UbiE
MAKIVDRAGDSVLDVGCGIGTYVAFCRGVEISAQGIDVDSERLDQALSAFGSFFSRASAESIPFADNAFETVLMWDVLEHVPSDQQALAEAIRVATRNILISVPKEHSPEIFNTAYGLTYKHYIDPEHKRYYTPERIEGLITRQKATIKSLEHWTRIYPAGVYKGAGVPHLLCAAIDRLLSWLWTRRSEAFMRNLFIELEVNK